MKYFYFLISALLLFCKISHSQTTICSFPTLKSEDIRFDEFNKLNALESNIKSVLVSKYTAYITSGQENKNNSDSVKQNVIVVIVNGNSLKDPELLKALNKFSPPFYVVFDEIKVIDLENNQRTIRSRSFRVL